MQLIQQIPEDKRRAVGYAFALMVLVSACVSLTLQYSDKVQREEIRLAQIDASRAKLLDFGRQFISATNQDFEIVIQIKKQMTELYETAARLRATVNSMPTGPLGVGRRGRALQEIFVLEQQLRIATAWIDRSVENSQKLRDFYLQQKQLQQDFGSVAPFNFSIFSSAHAATKKKEAVEPSTALISVMWALLGIPLLFAFGCFAMLFHSKAPNAKLDALIAAGVTVVRRSRRVEKIGNKVSVAAAGGAPVNLDVLYPVLGCTVRSELAISLGAACDETGNLRVDAHQQTTVNLLYAAGDVVTDLHQLSVATGHAAIAATDIHNRLPGNPR